jgi:hypothetical protein
VVRERGKNDKYYLNSGLDNSIGERQYSISRTLLIRIVRLEQQQLFPIIDMKFNVVGWEGTRTRMTVGTL